ncbi:MAG TPA: glycosyltransferase family 2 protein [Thermoanaerobaculia bacterium]|nr:glycosyltransferase family 2 protein [Thermoanaerobaculia bacterium]HQR68297.1 glycosyltransferase family 2 protein [Thermoanaerobaculia bacterium]
MPRVAVSLVTHNESRDAERLLPTVFAQTVRDLSIVAVDNASEDGTRAALAAFEKVAPLPMAVVSSRENLGYTGGHNLGIATALEGGAEWVLVLNADVVLDASFLERLLEEAARPAHAEVAAFTGKILRADGAELAPTRVLDTVGIRMTRSGRHFDIGAGCPDDGRYDAPAEIFGVSGCVALYRAAALADVRISTGFFDDDFFVYREDVDLAWRLRGRGWRARCVPSAVAWHRRRNLPERRREMSPLANLHSVKNRFLLRVNNAGTEHLRATFARTFPRDLLVVGGCLTVERTSLPALKWLAENRARLLAKRAEIQARRRASDRDLLRWFGDDPDGARIPG